MLCLYSYVCQHCDTIFEFTSFQARKGGFWPLMPKGPELGVVITILPPNQNQLSGNTSDKISRKHPERWTAEQINTSVSKVHTPEVYSNCFIVVSV